MKKLFVFILALQAGVVLSQEKNRFDISLGASYPINFAEEKLARKLGFDIGITYTKLFKYNIIMETGVQASVFQKISWKEYSSVQIYFPLAFGYQFNKLEVSAGIFLTITPWTSTSIHFTDPEIASVNNTEDYYYDLGFLHGRLFNYKFCVSYTLTKKQTVFWDSKVFIFSDSPNFGSDNNTIYSYSVNTIGLRYRL